MRARRWRINEAEKQAEIARLAQVKTLEAFCLIKENQWNT
jgi:hypothetical protein